MADSTNSRDNSKPASSTDPKASPDSSQLPKDDWGAIARDAAALTKLDQKAKDEAKRKFQEQSKAAPSSKTKPSPDSSQPQENDWGQRAKEARALMDLDQKAKDEAKQKQASRANSPPNKKK